MNKLREKFEKVHRGYLTPSNVTKECEQITDDFSVKFAEWVSKSWILDSDNIGYSHIYKDEWYTTKELQQYFKDNIYGN